MFAYIYVCVPCVCLESPQIVTCHVGAGKRTYILCQSGRFWLLSLLSGILLVFLYSPAKLPLLHFNLNMILDYRPVLSGLAKSRVWRTLSEAPVHYGWSHCFWVYNKAVHHGRNCLRTDCSLHGQDMGEMVLSHSPTWLHFPSNSMTTYKSPPLKIPSISQEFNVVCSMYSSYCVKESWVWWRMPLIPGLGRSLWIWG